MVSQTVNVRSKRQEVLVMMSKFRDVPKAKTVSLMVIIQGFAQKMFFQYLPGSEHSLCED